MKVSLKKVLPFVGTGRLLRFTAEGLLAIHYGRWILSLANSPVLKNVAVGMIVIAVCGSAYSIYEWMKK